MSDVLDRNAFDEMTAAKGPEIARQREHVGEDNLHRVVVVGGG